jgi:hypothetical protein
MYEPLLFPIRAAFPTDLFLSIWLPEQYWVMNTNN